MNSRRTALPAGLLALLVLVTLPAGAASPVEFSVRTDEGRLTGADLRGRVVLLDFWASWCAPCRKSFPWMNRMQSRYGEDGLVIIGVNVDSDPAAARAFLKDYPARFRIGFDPEGRLAGQFGVQGMPSSYLIGPEGRIRKTHIGFREAETENYERQIRRLVTASSDSEEDS